jgi:hypothetical protein
MQTPDSRCLVDATMQWLRVANEKLRQEICVDSTPLISDINFKCSHVIDYENLAGDYVKKRRDRGQAKLTETCGSPPSAFGLRSEI